MSTGKYFVAVDSFAVLTRQQSAKLYKLTGYRNQAVLAASGTVGQMQELADVLNSEESN